jgi:mevalonate kinase
MMKKILNRAVWILVFILIMSVVIWANIERSNSHCTDIEIKMKTTDYPSLTSSAAIKTNILETMPALIGQSVKNIELLNWNNLFHQIAVWEK